MLIRALVTFVREDQAATAVEYAVMLALILLAVIGTVAFLGQRTAGAYNNANSEFKAVGIGP